MTALNPIAPILSSHDISRFWKKVEIREQDDCWNWKHSLNRCGYGIHHKSKRRILAHVLARFISSGVWPSPGFYTLHECDNPACCNPRHLWIGTHLDNMRDRDRKGRVASGDRAGTRTKPESTPRGDVHWSRRTPEKMARGESFSPSKLNTEKVLEIRRLWSTGNHTQEAIARMFGVIQSNVSAIVLRRSWKHV